MFFKKKENEEVVVKIHLYTSASELLYEWKTFGVMNAYTKNSPLRPDDAKYHISVPLDYCSINFDGKVKVYKRKRG